MKTTPFIDKIKSVPCDRKRQQHEALSAEIGIGNSVGWLDPDLGG